jgi:hypothetical protein
MKTAFRPFLLMLLALYVALGQRAAVAAWATGDEAVRGGRSAVAGAAPFVVSSPLAASAGQSDTCPLPRRTWRRPSTRRAGRELIGRVPVSAAARSNPLAGALSDRGRVGLPGDVRGDARGVAKQPSRSRAPPALG